MSRLSNYTTKGAQSWEYGSGARSIVPVNGGKYINENGAGTLTFNLPLLVVSEFFMFDVIHTNENASHDIIFNTSGGDIILYFDANTQANVGAQLVLSEVHHRIVAFQRQNNVGQWAISVVH